jgi:hypothetical protein
MDFESVAFLRINYLKVRNKKRIKILGITINRSVFTSIGTFWKKRMVPFKRNSFSKVPLKRENLLRA